MPRSFSILQGLALFTVLCSGGGCPARAEDRRALVAENLRCEYTIDPLGIDERSPRLSWIGGPTRRGEHQSAYQVLVASTWELLAQDTGDRWDSGKVPSDESAHVVYSGRPLGSRDACFWKVRLWDRDGRASDWTQPAVWTMGLLEAADWQARWIDGSEEHPQPITIRHAVYETLDGQTSADVTAVLADHLRSGRKYFAHVDNALLGGDPAPGQKKQLRVDYLKADQTMNVVVEENSPLAFAQTIGHPFCLRKSFASPAGPITRATLYVTALGLYRCYLNGERVGDHVLAPDWTDYDKRVRYQAYDVTPLMRLHENTLAAVVADGWYSGHLGNGGFQQYGQIPALLAQLEIVHADGQIERVVTDGTWKSHGSPIQSSDFMLGENYDARQEMPGWSRSGFDDQSWPAAHAREEKPRALDAQAGPPVRQLSERQPVARTEPTPGKWIFDLGQNMVGVVRLKVHAPSGTKLTLRHAEMLNPDGTLYTTNLRGAPSVDTYICKGAEEEVWQPGFTFHGFRYVELTGLPDPPGDDAVTGIVLGSDTPRAGIWTCSDPRLNQLMSNIEWGRQGNYLSVPTDCPQRDERLGWMGDAQVFVRTATDLADVAGFFTKWLVDVDDAQTSAGQYSNVSPRRGSREGTPAWGDAGVICPWTIYEAYGDRRILERHLPAMTKWVDWCRAHSTNLLRDHDRGSDYGDWLSIGANTPKDVIGTAYFAYSTHLLAKAYGVTGHREEAEKYERLFEDVRDAFDRAYVAPDGRIKGNTQCVYAMALKFDLLPEALRPKAVQYLASDVAAHGNHLTTGFVGVSYLLPVLTAGGRLDTAYALLMQDTFPGWLFSVKHGATTIWERWDGWTPEKGFQNPGMNSFNHYSLGSCGEWLYDTVAGIDWDTDAPGYRRLLLHPQPGGGLTFARAARQTMYGEVDSEWKISGGRFTLSVTVPANTTARVILPTTDAALVTEGRTHVTEDADVKVSTPTAGKEVTLEVGSGIYDFECPLADSGSK